MTPRKRLLHGTLATAGFVLVIACTATLPYAGSALVVSSSLSSPDAIVSLASHEWERLPVAVQLARQYPDAQVWLTQPEHVTEHNCHECAGRVSWLHDAGVSRERVTVLPRKVTNTYDEAKAAGAFADRTQIDRLVVVTSAYHGRRALATFRHLFQSTGLRTRIGLMTATSRATPARWWRRAYDREYVAYEWAGIVYYAVRFGIPPTL